MKFNTIIKGSQTSNTPLPLLQYTRMFGHLDNKKPGILQQQLINGTPNGNFKRRISRQNVKLSTGKIHKHSTNLVQVPPKLTQTGPFGITWEHSCTHHHHWIHFIQRSMVILPSVFLKLNRVTVSTFLL